MVRYLIDENLPFFFPVLKTESFIHISQLPLIEGDSDIWTYALLHNLIIITKDSDFYYRYLSSKVYPKVIWLKTGNMKKTYFNALLETIWTEIEEMLSSSSFIIITEDKIQGF